MVTGPDLSSQHEVSVSMETDQLSGNLLLFMHRPGGEVQETGLRKGRADHVTDISSTRICIPEHSPQHVRQIKPEPVWDYTRKNEVKRAAAPDPSCGRCYNNTDATVKLWDKCSHSLTQGFLHSKNTTDFYRLRGNGGLALCSTSPAPPFPYSPPPHE